MRSACRALVAAALAAAAGAAAAAGFVVGPYKDVSIGIDAAQPRIAAPGFGRTPPDTVLVWAFATGECGSERWAEGVDSDAFARLNRETFERDGRRYIVSTGGAAGVFTCSSDDGWRRFVARYDGKSLAGFDFDIEGTQTPAQIGALVQRAAALQRARPDLRLSFTIATHAASDGSRRSLNATGEAVLRALRETGHDGAILNLMVMNYGEPDPRWCVVARGKPKRCDMARSALQAVHNVHERYGVPLARIAVTAMLGENDVAANVLRPADAVRLARDARRLGLAGLHWWSFDRDRPCSGGEPRVSPRCHALPGVPAGRFGALLQRGR